MSDTHYRTFDDVISQFTAYTPEQIALAKFWWNAGRDYLWIDQLKEPTAITELMLREQEEQA